MKRDMDLVRKILLEIEGNHRLLGFFEITFDGTPNEEVSYHIEIMSQAGLIEAQDAKHYVRAENAYKYRWYAGQLTWEGHEFLDAIRDEGRWKSIKVAAKKAGGFLSYQVLSAYIAKLIAAAQPA